MNVTYEMDEYDKGNQMDEEKHDMDENLSFQLTKFRYREQKQCVQLGFCFAR